MTKNKPQRNQTNREWTDRAKIHKEQRSKCTLDQTEENLELMYKLGYSKTQYLDPVVCWLDLPADSLKMDAKECELLGW